jgi:feruloyl-CoA hydratase/lyase
MRKKKEQSFETILIEKQGNGTTVVTFNRPEKRNAMSPLMHKEMVDALRMLKYDNETKVLVLTGAGNSFCAGQDLKEYFYKSLYEEGDPYAHAKNREMSHTWRFRELRNFPKVTIAKINGNCFGGAFTIITSCDLAIAADEAKIGLSELNFGHFAGGMVTKVVSEMLRPRDAMYYLLTGDLINGKRAAEIGLVNLSVPLKKLDAELERLLGKILDKDEEALRFQKELYHNSRHMGYEEAWRFSAAMSAEHTALSKGKWLKEGVGQFMKKKYKPGLGSFDKDAK